MSRGTVLLITRSRHTELVEVIDLILHQRDQGRYDQGEPGESQSGKLKAQRLATACGHDRQHVLSAKNEIDDFTLGRPEVVKAKALPENRARVHGLECKDTCGHPRTDGTTAQPFVFRARSCVTLTSEPNRRVCAIYCGGFDLFASLALLKRLNLMSDEGR